MCLRHTSLCDSNASCAKGGGRLTAVRIVVKSRRSLFVVAAKLYVSPILSLMADDESEENCPISVARCELRDTRCEICVRFPILNSEKKLASSTSCHVPCIFISRIPHRNEQAVSLPEGIMMSRSWPAGTFFFNSYFLLCFWPLPNGPISAQYRPLSWGPYSPC